MAKAKQNQTTEQAAPAEGAVLLVAVHPVYHDGRRYERDQQFEAPAEVAERLVRKGAARKVEGEG